MLPLCHSGPLAVERDLKPQLCTLPHFQHQRPKGQTNYCKCNSFQVTTNLLNSENFKIAFAHLYNELEVYNFIML